MRWRACSRALPPSPGLPPVMLEAWALALLSVPITSEKAGHALLLLRGQWAMSLFLKGQAGQWRKGGNTVGWPVWAGPRLHSAPLAHPEGDPEEAATRDIQYIYIMKLGYGHMDFKKLGPINVLANHINRGCVCNAESCFPFPLGVRQQVARRLPRSTCPSARVAAGSARPPGFVNPISVSAQKSYQDSFGFTRSVSTFEHLLDTKHCGRHRVTDTALTSESFSPMNAFDVSLVPTVVLTAHPSLPGLNLLSLGNY